MPIQKAALGEWAGTLGGVDITPHAEQGENEEGFQPPDLSAYLTPAQAAQVLGVTRQAVNNYLNKGILPSVQIMGARATARSKVMEYKLNRRENRAAK